LKTLKIKIKMKQKKDACNLNVKLLTTQQSKAQLETRVQRKRHQELGAKFATSEGATNIPENSKEIILLFVPI